MKGMFDVESVSDHEWETLVLLGGDLLKSNPTNEKVREVAGWLGNRAGLGSSETLQLRVQLANNLQDYPETEDLDVYGILRKNKQGAMEERITYLEEQVERIKSFIPIYS